VANRGRRRGPSKVPFPLRLTPAQKQRLELLRESLDGTPSLNGLIQTAIDRYISSKLEEPAIRAEFERRSNALPHAGALQ
jgi:hypothetical protein